MKYNPENSFSIIEKAIQVFEENPDLYQLENIALVLGIDYQELEAIIYSWSGGSVFDFFSSISPQQIKARITDCEPSLFGAQEENKIAQLHQRFQCSIQIEKLTDEKYKDTTSPLEIIYCFSNSIYGKIILASTNRGLCYIAFDENEEKALVNLARRFPTTQIIAQKKIFQEEAMAIFNGKYTKGNTIHLNLRGTDFQINVWKALLQIPIGQLVTYHQIAQNMGIPKAARAVGTAIGKNPIALLIPCHRAVRSSGEAGKYMWGNSRKLAIIGWEAMQLLKLDQA